MGHITTQRCILLAILAHPDDETMLCGGTLAALAGHGVEVHVLCATRGEGGEMGEPPLGTRQELGRVREAEMQCACQALGVHRVEFLDYVDPMIGPDNTLYPFAEDEDALRERLMAHVRRLRPDVVFTHGRDGEYGHPAHKLLHRVAWDAFGRLCDAGENPPYFYTIVAAIAGIDDHLFNQSEPAHLILELKDTPWLDAKHAAALCHATQHALFKRRKKAQTVREILRRIESLHRYWPPDGPDAPALVSPTLLQFA